MRKTAGIRQGSTLATDQPKNWTFWFSTEGGVLSISHRFDVFFVL